MNVYELDTKLLEELMYIATSVGRSLMIDRVCKSCSLRIESYDFIVDLIVLGIDDFDIILGMDLLFDNHVTVNC